MRFLPLLFFVVFCLVSANVEGIDHLLHMDGKASTRILYGVDANIQDYPFFASLEHCGAAILSKEWVVTAAHCIPPAIIFRQNYIWVGGNTLKSSKRVPYDRVVVHPDAGEHKETNAPINDIALIHLAKPLRFSDRVKAVALPTDDVSRERNLVFVGRGTDESGFVSETLKKMDVARITSDECVSYMPIEVQAFIKSHLKFLEKICICAMREDDKPGLCSGDSGSPLVHNNTLVGLASFIGNSCEDGRLGFYVNVATYVPWIKSVIGLE